MAATRFFRIANLFKNQRDPLKTELEDAQRADELLAAGDMDWRGAYIQMLRVTKKMLAIRSASIDKTCTIYVTNGF